VIVLAVRWYLRFGLSSSLEDIIGFKSTAFRSPDRRPSTAQ
jgi:hypothetical protein